MTRPERRLADALGQLLLRDTRVGLYATVVDGVAGVDATTYPVLSGLARTGEVTISELAGRVGLDRSVASRHASALEAHGLLVRRTHADDRRATTLALTAAGRDAVERTRERLDAALAAALADRSPAEAEALADLLADLVAALRR